MGKLRESGKNDESRYGDVTNLSVFSILHALMFSDPFSRLFLLFPFLSVFFSFSGFYRDFPVFLFFRFFRFFSVSPVFSGFFRFFLFFRFFGFFRFFLFFRFFPVFPPFSRYATEKVWNTRRKGLQALPLGARTGPKKIPSVVLVLGS